MVLALLAPAIAKLGVGGKVTREERAATPKGASPYRSHAIWLFSVLLLLYVGVEVGTGGWLATYMQSTTQTIPQTAALVASGFYLALTAGRVAAAGLGTKLSPERLLMLSLVGAVLGGLVMLFGIGNSVVTIAGALLLGVSFGPVFPTVIAILTAYFAVGTGKAVSIVIASGSLGGTLIPLLQGILLKEVGAQALVQLIVVVTFGMLLLLGLFRVAERRRQAGSVAQSAPGSRAME
jgi:fucose permease